MTQAWNRLITFGLGDTDMNEGECESVWIGFSRLGIGHSGEL
jgi:hypothetical protein